MLGRVGPLSEIYESYNDCFAATEGGSIDQQALVDLGWSKGAMEGAEGASPIIFARADRAPVLMLSAESGKGFCAVMAGFEDAAAVGTFLSAWGDGLPEFEDGQLNFFAEGRPILFRKAGSQDKPRLNLIVGTGSETKE